MRISYYTNQIALNAQPVLNAFLQGCAQLGIETVANSTEADAAVIWSMLWHGRMKDNEAIYRMYRSQGKPVFVLEVGMLQRGITWKLGLNGTGKDCYPGIINPYRANQLHISCSPWKNNGVNIIIACQRTDSEQWVGQPSMTTWLNDTVKILREHSDRPIIVRPHPRQRISNISGCTIESPKPIPGTYDSFDFDHTLLQTWAVINWNSGPGCQSIINGVPSFVGPSSLAANVANLDLTHIETPIRPNREEWLNQLAHSEWTITELASGEPLNRLLFSIPS